MCKEIDIEDIYKEMKELGHSVLAINKVRGLHDGFNGNTAQFVIATKGQLQATYTKLHPEFKRGIATRILRAYDCFVKLYKNKLYVNSATSELVREKAEEKARADASEEERRKADIKLKVTLGQEIDLETLSSVVCYMLNMGIKKCSMDDMLGQYHFIKDHQGVQKQADAGADEEGE